jgi:outer membrane lipoprotein-sorting protein
MKFKSIRGFLFAAAVFSMAASVWPQGENPGSAAGLSTAQIVEQMQRHEQLQTQKLRSYKTLRHYEVEYRGFSKQVEAKMDVEVVYNASSGKNLTIVSQSGSKFLLDKVLKRAVDSEKEAFQNKKSLALTPANYRFKQVGRETLAGRPAYILEVEPLVPTKFLYRGRIWVDAADFATVKMETEPAKSPSFWISRTRIHYTGVKTDGFWMPREVRSETSVRIGGVAVLIIDYGNYRIASSPVSEALANLRR